MFKINAKAKSQEEMGTQSYKGTEKKKVLEIFNIQYLIFLIVLLAGNQVFAQKKMVDIESFKQTLVSNSQKLKTLESDFVQKKHLEVLAEPVVSNGVFSFKRENRVRWEYAAPSKYLIVINNDKVMIKDNGKTNIIDIKSNKMMKEITDMMTSCFSGNMKTIEKSYSVTYLEDDKNYIAKMSPLGKGAAKFLKSIDLYFDKTNMMMSKLIIMEPSNDYTEYIFNNRKLNTDIADEKFRIN